MIKDKGHYWTSWRRSHVCIMEGGHTSDCLKLVLLPTVLGMADLTKQTLQIFRLSRPEHDAAQSHMEISSCFAAWCPIQMSI